MTIDVEDVNAPYISGSAVCDILCQMHIVPISPTTGPACPGETVELYPPACYIACYQWLTPEGSTGVDCPYRSNPCPGRLIAKVPGRYTLLASYWQDGCFGVGTTDVVFLDQVAIAAPSEIQPHTQYVASVPAMSITYEWSISGGVITSGADTNRIEFTAGDAGRVTLGVTMRRWKACSVTRTKTILVRPAKATARLPERLSRCGAGTMTIPIVLAGAPPFELTWSDGVRQGGVMTYTAARDIDVTAPVMLSVVSITDAAGDGSPSEPVALLVDTPAFIRTEPSDVTVHSGDNATFSVSAAGENLHYAWYFVPAAGPLSQVGVDAPSFTTSWPVTKPETYLVRVSNACGTVDSVQATAWPAAPRQRAAGH